MKKIIFILALFVSFVANSQYTPPPGYTNINSRYDWLAGVFRALGIPAGGSAAFTTGQSHRAGAIYYDSTGIDSGLYVWSGLAWRNYDPATLTASQGITKVGSDFQLGGLVTEDKTISVDNNNHQFQMRKTVGGYPFAFVSEDTIIGINPSGIRSVGFVNGRTLKFPSYAYIDYKGGSVLQLEYQIKDSARMPTVGGDFGFSNKTAMQLTKMAGYSGRSVYMGGDGLSLSEGVPVQLNDLTLQHSTSTTSNYRYAKGYWIGNRSYLVIGQADTLENWVGFHNMGFMQGTARVNYAFDFVGGHFGSESAAKVANPWFLYGHSTRSKSLIAGPTGFGDSTIDASALIDASSTTKGVIWPRMTTTQKNAIASPATGLIVFDTDLVQYNFWDGDSWEAMGGGAAPTAFNDIGDATGAGLVTVGNNSQQWDFTGLTGSGLLIQSNTTAATNNLHKVLRVVTTGANAGTPVTSFGSEIINSHTGTASTNIALSLAATGGTNNHALVVGSGNGNVGFGTATPNSTAILELSDTARGFLPPRMTAAQRTAIGSPGPSLFLWDNDSTRYMGYNGSAWRGIAWTGEGGGGGSGTVNSGTQYRLGYYATTGDAISEAAAITGDRALISDVNGVPTHSVTTATELGYVSGVISAIQTQLDAKQNLLVNSAGLAAALSDETGTGLSVFNTTPTFTTNITTPSVIGGTSTTQSLIYKTTTGVGTTGADHIFQVGNNGATEAMRILNSGNVGIGISPTEKLHILGNQLITPAADSRSTMRINLANGNHSMSLGSYTGAPQFAGFWAGNITPSASNYSFISDGISNTVFNGPQLQFRINQNQSPSAMTIASTFRVGIGVDAPTANLHLKAGTATANTAPLKLTSGTNLTTPEAGAVEFDGTNYFGTASTTRYTLAKTLMATATLDFASTGSGAVADLTITVTGAADGDVVSLGVPNAAVTATATYSAWISAADTVTVRFSPKATEDPASGTFRVSVIKY